MDMYTDERGFKCQEFLQDLRVGVTYNYLTFHIVVEPYSLPRSTPPLPM